MKKGFVWLLLFIAALPSQAQLTRYIIQLKDKANNPYTITNPESYLSARSLERRTRFGLAVDSTDLPVTPRYIDSIRLAGNVTVLNVSKWLNQVSIQTTDAAALNKINSFPFVQAVSGIAARQRAEAVPPPQKFQQLTETPAVQQSLKTTVDFFSYGSSAAQVNMHNGQFLHNIGLRGQGMVIGMLDAGFYNYTGLKAFDSINASGQVLGTWDFVARHTTVAEDHPHGMQCLSVIAANIPGQFVGTAPKAQFYLFRTEDASSEYPIEEHNWVCGAERVDSAGGDVISSSLGYSTFENATLSHTYAQMNGNNTIAATGADLAAKKGLLVVNAAGNEGTNGWHYIMTPADADSILVVGAVDRNQQPASFSSYGPSADGQVKPDVASLGVATIIQGTGNNIGSGNGTSFACPNMAGLATCLWQGFPEVNNMKIIQVLRQASHNYSTPNDRVGYGIPDVKLAFTRLLKEFTTASATINNCNTVINWKSKDVAGMRYEIERKAAADTAFKKIAEVTASTGSFGTRTYQYADQLNTQTTSTISYRIRQVIDTAASTFTAMYLDTVSVALNMACNSTGRPVLVFPNPTPNHFSVQVNNTEAIDPLYIRLYDAAGKLVMEKKVTKPAAIAVFPFQIGHLPKGKYFITLLAREKRIATEEIVKL